jgi:hypothetical protein
MYFLGIIIENYLVHYAHLTSISKTSIAVCIIYETLDLPPVTSQIR